MTMMMSRHSPLRPPPRRRSPPPSQNRLPRRNLLPHQNRLPSQNRRQPQSPHRRRLQSPNRLPSRKSRPAWSKSVCPSPSPAPPPSFGEIWSAGVNLAVNEINSGDLDACSFCEPGGGVLVGDTVYTIDLRETDTRSETQPALASTVELIRDEQVQYFFGPILDGAVIVTQEETNPQKVILFGATTNIGDVLTPESAGPGGEKRYLFKTQIGEAGRQVMMTRATRQFFPDAERMQLMINDDTIGQFIAPLFEQAYNAAGYEVLDTIFFPPSTTDFSAFLTRIKGREPDLLHIWWGAGEVFTALQQSFELEVAPAYEAYFVDPGFFKEQFPDGVNAPVALLCVPLCWGEPSSQRAADFFARLEAGGTELTLAAGLSLLIYDFVFMAAKAWQDAGTVTDTDAVVAALEALQYQGVGGALEFDERHVAVNGWDVCLTSGDLQFDCELFQATAEEQTLLD